MKNTKHIQHTSSDPELILQPSLFSTTTDTQKNNIPSNNDGDIFHTVPGLLSSDITDVVPIALHDLEAMRLLLSGDSVVDWNRANFRNMEEVNRFLGLHLLDYADAQDKRRLEYLFASAVEYLEQHIGLRFTQDVKEIPDIRNLFLLASQNESFRRRQVLACTTLKIMHVLQHMDSAELRYQAPLAEATLLAKAEEKILTKAKELQTLYPNVLEFYGSRKQRESVISKLLVKKGDVASTVFDKLRFRIITKSEDDLLPVLVWLGQHVFPFNFIIPEQSHNNLLSFSQMLLKLQMAEPLSNGVEHTEKSEAQNGYSSARYKVINFIADVPVSLDTLIPNYPYTEKQGKVVYVMVEFQVIDCITAENNEQGDSAHEKYKQRQLEQVKNRLQHGKNR